MGSLLGRDGVNQANISPDHPSPTNYPWVSEDRKRPTQSTYQAGLVAQLAQEALVSHLYHLDLK